MTELEQDLKDAEIDINKLLKIIVELEGERDTLRTAIKQYLDCQTTNQWVVHFKKALSTCD